MTDIDVTEKTPAQQIADCRTCEQVFEARSAEFTEAVEGGNRGDVNKSTYAYSKAIVDLQAAYEALEIVKSTRAARIVIRGIKPEMRSRNTDTYANRYQVSLSAHRGMRVCEHTQINDALAMAALYARTVGDMEQEDFWLALADQ